MRKPFDWTDLVESARLRCSAAPRNLNAAKDVIRHSAVALRDLLRHNMVPDPERRVYLDALLEGLERIEDGIEPTLALHFRPGGRTRDERLFARNLKVFISVGKELDKLTLRGHTRGDKPVDAAKQRVCRATGLSRTTIDKVWTEFKSRPGWEKLRAEMG